MDSLAPDGDGSVLQIGADQCDQGSARASRPIRPMHTSTLTLADQTSCPGWPTTTYTQGYSGRTADGKPLVFELRSPRFPSQHTSQLELKNTPDCRMQSHTRDVHGPINVLPRVDLSQENWVRYCGGGAMKEVTNPQEPTPYRTSYQSQQQQQQNGQPAPGPSGKPIPWHQYDILTGYPRQAGLETPKRLVRHKVLWAARRRETNCCAFRLY